MNLCQHFLTPEGEEPFRWLLPTLGLRGKTVIEIGFGHGELSKLILDYGNPRRLIGYEIDQNLSCTITDPRFEPHYEDFLLATWPGEPFILIANPPYDLLPVIIQMERGAEAAMLMVPEGGPFLQGWETAFVLPGTAFNPQSRGNHAVRLRGFDHVR